MDNLRACARKCQVKTELYFSYHSIKAEFSQCKHSHCFVNVMKNVGTYTDSAVKIFLFAIFHMRVVFHTKKTWQLYTQEQLKIVNLKNEVVINHCYKKQGNKIYIMHQPSMANQYNRYLPSQLGTIKLLLKYVAIQIMPKLYLIIICHHSWVQYKC